MAAGRTVVVVAVVAAARDPGAALQGAEGLPGPLGALAVGLPVVGAALVGAGRPATGPGGVLVATLVGQLRGEVVLPPPPGKRRTRRVGRPGRLPQRGVDGGDRLAPGPVGDLGEGRGVYEIQRSFRDQLRDDGGGPLAERRESRAADRR